MLLFSAIVLHAQQEKEIVGRWKLVFLSHEKDTVWVSDDTAVTRFMHVVARAQLPYGSKNEIENQAKAMILSISFSKDMIMNFSENKKFHDEHEKPSLFEDESGSYTFIGKTIIAMYSDGRIHHCELVKVNGEWLLRLDGIKQYLYYKKI